ncbi:MAG TPA: hypothetical protein VKT28_09190 [Puia sp.]|nr:hypothetical protein [Puia sp.]
MKRKLTAPSFLVLSFYFSSCHSNNQNNSAQTDSASKPIVINPTNNVPEFRKTISKDIIAEYKEKTDNPLNNWYFSVKIYESEKTLHYIMKLQFEEIKGEDTLKLPNFGYELKPVIQKGKEKYSCVIGFMDDKNKFREYKLVHVEDGNHLKVTTLKHYSVATYQE